MAKFLQAVTDGILGGAVYALMAAGLTLIFGVMDIINIAQGVLVVLAAYLSYVLSVHLHIDPLLGLLITVPAMFVLGKDGRVRATHAGYASKATGPYFVQEQKEFLAELDRLLAEK